MRVQRLSHCAAEYFFLDIVLCLWVKRFRLWGGNVRNNLSNYKRNIPEEVNFHVGAVFTHKKKKLNAFDKDPL